jgi:hypothetical protein
VEQVALEGGKSPAMIFSNYWELVTTQDAEARFAITPERTKVLREKAEVLADGHQR